MASISSDNRDGTACDKCGAPPSWANTSTSNLSWQQSLKHHLDMYLTSPRMWPIGYIVQSPYSPLRLEIEMPSHGSWRDAFEDLLALESGGRMISLESRNKEAKVAKRVWHGSISRNVDFINDQLKSYAKYISILKRLQDLAARKNWTQPLETIARDILDREKAAKQTIAAGKTLIAMLEENMGKSWPASNYKMRGQWMASLVSSGALPGWHAQIYSSSLGEYQVGLSKVDGDPDDPDDHKMTENEIAKQFEEGIPMQVGNPTWSTDVGHYPEPSIVQEDDSNDASIDYVKPRHLPLRPSILSQSITAECPKSEKGNLSTKVTLRNLFTDGTIEQKEIVDDSSKVLEENEKVYASMHARNTAVNIAAQEAQYDGVARPLKWHEENGELD